MNCLDANAVQGLMSGALGDSDRAVVVSHLDACEECRELLAAMASDALRAIGAEAANLERPAAMASDALRAAGAEAANLERPAAVAGDIAHSPTLAGDSQAAGVLVEPEPSPAPGSVLGRYSLEAKIGEGAMGMVWRAHDPKLGRQVALKLLRRRDRIFTKQLVSEAQAMARLAHPNVVAVHDVGVVDGTTYIAMELVTGSSLRDWLTATERRVPDILTTFIAAGRGLAAAHAAGIVHRDFKPDNVLIGNDGRVRVSDFGLASGPNDGDPQRGFESLDTLIPGALLGTPAYMAPEQFSGGNVDPRTDQFSFCASLYEALYGQRPFSGRTFEELADNVVKGRVQSPPKHRYVSRDLRALVMRGLSQKPGDRFPSLEHLLAELGRDRARPWRRATTACAALAGALLIGLGADAVVRTRVAIQIEQSFALTGRQLDHTAKRLSQHFHDVSAIAYRESALRQVAGHHDQADFFLGTPASDQLELDRLHQMLVATDWAKVGDSQRAVIDYKGRLLFTSYAPQLWNTDTRGLAPIRRALDAGQGDSVTVLSTTDPGLASTGILGPRARPGVVVMFARVLALGDAASNGSEARAIYLELEDARRLLDELRLDDQTLLALVANDGTIVGDPDLPPSLVTAPQLDGTIQTLAHEGESFQVQSRTLRGLDGTGQIARIAMARKLEGVLQLFPGARSVFVVAALTAFAAAVGAALRARALAGPLDRAVR